MVRIPTGNKLGQVQNQPPDPEVNPIIQNAPAPETAKPSVLEKEQAKESAQTRKNEAVIEVTVRKADANSKLQKPANPEQVYLGGPPRDDELLKIDDPFEGKLLADTGGPQVDAKTSGTYVTDRKLDGAINQARSKAADLPVWKDNARILWVKNHTGMKEYPTLEEAKWHPMVQKFDESDANARNFYSAAETSFKNSKLALQNGDAKEAQRLYEVGLGLTKTGDTYAKRNEQWTEFRLKQNERALGEAIKDYSGSLAMDLGLSTAVGMIQLARGIPKLYKAMNQTKSTMDKKMLGEILSDPKAMAKADPEVIKRLSNGSITLDEAKLMVRGAGLREAPLVAADTLTKDLISKNENLTGLANLLNNPQKLARMKPDELVEATGKKVTQDEAKLLINAADMKIYAQTDAMSWQNSVKRLRATGDVKTAETIENFVKETQGHHQIVWKAADSFNAKVPGTEMTRLAELKTLSPDELAKRYELKPDEAKAFADDLQALDDTMHFQWHDLWGPAGKNRPWVGRHLGKEVKKGEGDVNLDAVLKAHREQWEHHPLNGRPMDSISRAEEAIDVIAARRQARSYKASNEWGDILNDIEKIKDPRQRAWYKVAYKTVKDMENSGVNVMRPQDQVTRFVYPQEASPDILPNY